MGKPWPGHGLDIWGQGPGPGRNALAIGARAPGPRALLVGRTDFQKMHPQKRGPDMLFDCFFMEIQKKRDARTSRFHQVSRRDLCYVSENKGFRFYQKGKIEGPEPPTGSG